MNTVKPIITAILSFTLLTGCTVTKAIPQGDDHGKLSQNSSSAGWKYEIEITKPGTKSEGKLGRLYYKGEEIGSYFRIIVVGNRRYTFEKRRFEWNFGGYREEIEAELPESKSDLRIADAELERGWYTARLDRRRIGTPASWVWVKRGDLEAFVNPEKIEALARIYAIAPMSPHQFDLLPERGETDDQISCIRCRRYPVAE